MGGKSKKSKKPSGTKAESLLDAAIFFVDRCLGRQVGLALCEAGWKVERHEDHFPDDAEDAAWLPVVGERGWVTLTKDKAIRRNEVERRAVVASGARVFALSGNLTSKEMSEILLENKLKIARFLKNYQAPYIARVSRSGVALVFPQPASTEAEA